MEYNSSYQTKGFKPLTPTDHGHNRSIRPQFSLTVLEGISCNFITSPCFGNNKQQRSYPPNICSDINALKDLPIILYNTLRLPLTGKIVNYGIPGIFN